MSCVAFLDTHSELLRKVEVGELITLICKILCNRIYSEEFVVALDLVDEIYDIETN